MQLSFNIRDDQPPPVVGSRFQLDERLWEVVSVEPCIVRPDEMRPWLRAPGFRVKAASLNPAEKENAVSRLSERCTRGSDPR